MGGLSLTASFSVDDYSDTAPHFTLTSSPAVTSLVREHTMAYEEFSPLRILPSWHSTLLVLGPTAVLNMSARGTSIVVPAWDNDHWTVQANTIKYIIRSPLPGVSNSVFLYRAAAAATITTKLHQQTGVRLILKLITFFYTECLCKHCPSTAEVGD